MATKPTADELKAFAEEVKSGKHSLADAFKAESWKAIGTHFAKEGSLVPASPLYGFKEKLGASGADLPKLGTELHGHIEKYAKNLQEFGAEVTKVRAAALHNLQRAKDAEHLTEEQVEQHIKLLDAQLDSISKFRKRAAAELEKAGKYVEKTTKVAPNAPTADHLAAAAEDIKKFGYAMDRGWFGRRGDDIATTFRTTDGGLKKFGRVIGTGAGVVLIYDGTKRALRGLNLAAPKLDSDGKAVPMGIGHAIGGVVEDAAGIAAIYYSLIGKGRGINLGRM